MDDKLVRLSHAISAAKTGADDWDGGCNIGRDRYIEKAFADIPAVDAVEVRHGHWNTLTDCSNSGTYCSECNTKIFDFTHKPKNKLSRYCAACGARMDGEDGGA